jgi:hypothetical protein
MLIPQPGYIQVPLHPDAPVEPEVPPVGHLTGGSCAASGNMDLMSGMFPYLFLLSWSNFCIFVLDTRHLLRSMQAFLFEGADLLLVPSARWCLFPISFCQNLLLKGVDQQLCSGRVNSGEGSRFPV